MVKTKDDMTGWNMWEHGVPDSKITVIKQVDDYIDSRGRRYSQWLCYCSCNKNKTFVIRGSSLRNGSARSCGCIKKEIPFGRPKEYNKYDLSGEYGVGWTSNTNEEFYFDLEDYNVIKEYTWYAFMDGSTKALGAWDNERQSRVLMHQLLGFYEYDHEDRNELNNRKVNLRPCTKSQNRINANKRSDNTSGFTGVSYHQSDNKWWVRISVNKKETLVGRYSNKEDAIIARLKAEKEHYGEFAPQRHLFEKYEIQ